MRDFATTLAGLAFLFAGLTGLKTAFRQLATPRIRRYLEMALNHPSLAAAWGVLAGAMTQSATVVSFVLTGLLATGGITLTSALVVVSFANLGTTLLVYAASMDTRAMALLLIGIGGLLGGLTSFERLRPLFVILSGIGSIFLGLVLLREAGTDLASQPWFDTLATGINDSALAVFLLAVAMRTVIQSTGGVVLIAATLASTGMLAPPQVLLFMHGTVVGVGLSGWLLGRSIRGIPRRIILFQGLLHAVVGGVFALAWWLDQAAGLSLLVSWITAPTADAAPLAWVPFGFLLHMASLTLLGMLALPFVGRLLERLSPSTLEEDIARPQYLAQHGGDDPISGLALVRAEQDRLISHLPMVLASLSADGRGSAESARSAASGLNALLKEIDSFLAHLPAAGMPEVAASILRRQADQQHLQDLLESCDRYRQRALGFSRSGREEPSPAVLQSMHEALNFLLETLAAAHSSDAAGSAAESQMLEQITRDNGGISERIRGELAAQHLPGDAAQLLELAALFERSVWCIQRLTAGGR